LRNLKTETELKLLNHQLLNYPISQLLNARLGNPATRLLICFAYGPHKKWEHVMKRFALVAVIAVLMLAGCKVSTPGKIESGMMKEIKKTVTIGDKDVKNPIAYSEAAAKEGGEHFQHHCQICHGLDGYATGVPFAEKMSPPVPDLSSQDVQEYTDGQLRFIIANGIAPSGMPAWKGILTDDEMWKMVHYIRHLPAKGSLGIPDVFKEEQEEHEHASQPGQPKKDESKPHTHTHKH
jgi:mono/diheme cytochrome c family protein